MKTKKNAEAVNVNAEADKLTQFEAALLQAVKAGLLRAEAENAAIMKAGFGVPDEEHAACKPISAKEQAALALAAFGIDTAQLEAETAQAGTLAVNTASLTRAFGKYGKHVYAADTANGTSLVTHNVATQLLSTGKCLLPEVLKAVREYLPNYSSTGHYNTLKRMLKAEGYKLNVWQAGFSITK